MISEHRYCTFAFSFEPKPPRYGHSQRKQTNILIVQLGCILVISFISNYCLFAEASDEIISNHIGVNDNQIIAYLTKSSNLCPKTLNCTEGYFDEGKDCHEASRVKCNCIAHCCLAFDCRDWGNLVQCRRKCGATPNRFGLRRSEQIDCDKYACERHFFDQAWDSRGATDSQRNCIGHCCYAFDCRKALGYCRHACGVDAWVTARPLG